MTIGLKTCHLLLTSSFSFSFPFLCFYELSSAWSGLDTSFHESSLEGHSSWFLTARHHPFGISFLCAWRSVSSLLCFSNSIHQEVASDSFCFLINSSWLLVFILFLFLHALGLNLYWWKGIHFS